MPPLRPVITSRSNERVKALRQSFSGKPSRPGELVGIEGYTMVNEALRSGLRFETFFVRQPEAEDLLSGAVLARLRPQHTLVLSREVFESVVDTTSPQEVGATVEIPARCSVDLRSPTATVLVLEDIQDPGNVGTLIRSAEAFGAAEVVLTPGCANPWGPKVIRASAGSVFRQPLSRIPTGEALRMLKGHGVHIAGAVAESNAATIAPAARLIAPVAVVIGNEGSGLSSTALSLIDERVYIPCLTESLNAAVAGSLLLYEALQQNLARHVAEEQGKSV